MERGLLALRRNVSGFAGIVLAGGRSSRMGRDKALLVHGGATLLDRAVALLRDSGAAQVLVSGERPAHGGIGDRVPGQGPVGGIASVLARCGGDAILVVPVDMPDLDTTMLRPLVDALSAAPAARYSPHPLPWAARVDGGLRAALDRLLAERPGGPSMRALHAAVGGIDLEPPDPSRLRNLNTPQDWTSFER
jgi:molybdopterin-guanine dinucleotide biosynthesis protein A